jgi:GTP cyclohydrolase I
MTEKPSREEALAAVKTLISWAGDDPTREGLVETPDRVIRAYREFFAGVEEVHEQVVAKNGEEGEGFDDAVLVRNISVE